MGSKKAIKSITSAFTFGASDMILKEKDPQADAAKKNARMQEEQARIQAQQAAEAAAQAQKQISLDAERQQLQQAAAEQQNVETDAPTITLAGDEDIPIQDKRKRFRSQSIGGKAGASVRV